MDVMMARTKPKVALSYRSVGSGSGAADISSQASAFGCGDVPLPGTTFDSMVTSGIPAIHVPFLVGSVSVFYNVPGIGQGLYLSPCTLARVFRGKISVWNDPDVIAENPQLTILANISDPIRIVHRNNGSSSTYALTHYFNRACPQEWSQVVLPNSTLAPIGTGPDDRRNIGVTTEWPANREPKWATVTNSQTMVESIASNPYSIGYVESGQGLAAGLDEVEIQTANGTRRTSEGADILPQSLLNTFPSDLANRSWVAFNPVYQGADNPNQWPLTLGSYFYVRQDLTFLGQSGGLLVQFLRYMLSDDVAALMPEYGFLPMPPATRNATLDGLAALLTWDTSVPWAYEATTSNAMGQKDFVFSRQRDSYTVNTLGGLVADAREAKRTLSLGDAYQVHGSGSFVSALFLRRAMSVLQSRARVPVSMTYRAVGSLEAQAEFRDYKAMYAGYNHFKVSDMPLDSAVWSELSSPPASNTTAAVLQLPFAVSALGLYYNKALPRGALALDCATLARLYTGNLTSWADSGLAQLNNYTQAARDTLLSYSIVVYGMAGGTGPNQALTSYLASAACPPGAWPAGAGAAVDWAAYGVRTTYGPANKTIASPEDMLAALGSTPHSLGYLPSPLGAASGLAEAALLLAGAPRTPEQLPGDAAITQALAASPSLLSSATADLASLLGGSLYGQPGGGAWPMPLVQYLFMYRNLAGYGYSGPLLRAFAKFLYSDEGSELAAASGLSPMPPAVRSAMSGELSRSLLRALTVAWEDEPAGSYAATGSGLFTFSANRQSYEAAQLAALAAEVAALRDALAEAGPLTLRVACSPDTAPLTRLLRNDVQDMSSTPVRMLDEMLPAASSVSALRAAVAGRAAPTHMLVYPGPLPRDSWRALAADIAVAQVPLAIRPIAVAYRGAPGLRLSPCTLARVFSRQITTWDSADIRAENPNATLPSNLITLLSANDADATAVLHYLRRACPAAAALQLPNPPLVVRPGISQQLATAAAHTGLALLPASALVAEAVGGAGLAAVALPSAVSGTYVTPSQTAAFLNASTCPASGCGGAVAAAYGAALDAMLAATPPSAFGAPADPAGDWSGFSLMPPGGPAPGQDVYPVSRLDFAVLPADLSPFGPAGALAAAALAYGSGADLAGRLNSALGPHWAALGEGARRALAAPALGLLRPGPNEPAWKVVADSAEQANAAYPAATLVSSRAPATLEVALPGSDAAADSGSAGSGRGGSGNTDSGSGSGSRNNSSAVVLTQADVKALANEAVRSYAADKGRVDLAYSVGVAALVLALVLSLTALVLAALALARMRGTRGGAGGCLTPPGKAYVEMEMETRGAGPHRT